MSEVTLYDKQFARLSLKPKAKEIKINEQARGAKYIPIGVVEGKLDDIYGGLWQTKNFRYQVVVNEIIGSIELHVFIEDKGWLVREGCGSVPIQMSKGSGVTQVEQKIKNTLVKDFPHLKSECIKNAAKGLGITFGRDLNRKQDAVYVSALNPDLTKPIEDWQITKIDSLLQTSTVETPTKRNIMSDMQEYDFKRANACIAYLEENQTQSMDEIFQQELNRKNT